MKPINFSNQLVMSRAIKINPQDNMIVALENLKKGEIEGKFTENVSSEEKKIQFFFMGPKNKWKNVLPEDIKYKLNNYFKNDLSILNYEV